MDFIIDSSPLEADITASSPVTLGSSQPLSAISAMAPSTTSSSLTTYLAWTFGALLVIYIGIKVVKLVRGYKNTPVTVVDEKSSIRYSTNDATRKSIDISAEMEQRIEQSQQ
jgi:hypothetical protein